MHDLSVSFMSLYTGCRYFTLAVLQLLSLFIDVNASRNVTSSVLVSSSSLRALV